MQRKLAAYNRLLRSLDPTDTATDLGPDELVAIEDVPQHLREHGSSDVQLVLDIRESLMTRNEYANRHGMVPKTAYRRYADGVQEIATLLREFAPGVCDAFDRQSDALLRAAGVPDEVNE